MDAVMSWIMILIGVIIVLALLFVFIKAATKSAIRDVLEEMELKKREEEAKKRW